jgi:hypothetical protein
MEQVATRCVSLLFLAAATSSISISVTDVVVFPRRCFDFVFPCGVRTSSESPDGLRSVGKGAMDDILVDEALVFIEELLLLRDDDCFNRPLLESDGALEAAGVP